MTFRRTGFIFAVLLVRSLGAQCPGGEPRPCEAERRASAARDGKSVAVLYLDSRSRDEADLQLAAGITEEIVDALSADARLDVRSTFVSRSLAREGADPLSGARAQHIGWLVGGAFRASGDSMHLRIELTRVATGRVEKPLNLELTRAEFASTMSRISQLIAGQIAGRILPQAQAAKGAHVVDPEALVLFLRARIGSAVLGANPPRGDCSARARCSPGFHVC